MHVELLDYRCASSLGDTGTNVEAMACASSDLPIIAITTGDGLRALSCLGVNPAAHVSPVAGSARLTMRSLRRTLRVFEATAVRCRSPYASHLADLTNLPISIELVPPDLEGLTPSVSRHAIRDRLGLTQTDRLCVPLAARDEDIDAILLAMCAGALSIAEVPLVMAQPNAARHANRARRLLSSSDRPLDVFATHIPMLALAPAADVLLWGPHADRNHFDQYGLKIEHWARQFDVPFMCSNRLIDAILEQDGTRNHASERLVACNGISGTEIASSMLTALGTQLTG